MAILSLWLRLLSFTVPSAQPARKRSPRGAASRFQPVIENLEGRLVPSTVRWANPAGGDWADAANWDAGAVPGPDDDVVIDMASHMTITHAAGQDAVHSLTSRNALNLSGGSLALAADSTLTDLDLSGGTLSGTADITVNGRLHWTAGNLGGSPNRYGTPWLAARGGLTIDGPDDKLLEDRSLDNRADGSISGGPLTVHVGRLNNWAGVTLDMTAATVQEISPWSGFFANDGKVRVFDGGTLAVSHLSNSGTMEIYQGWLSDPVATASVMNSGTIHLWDIAGGLNAQGDQFQTTGSITGPGSVRVGASAGISGEFHVDGDATFTAPVSSTVADFYVGRALSFTSDFSFGHATVRARTLDVFGFSANGRLEGTSLFVGLEIIIGSGSTTFDSANVQTNTFAVNGTQFQNISLYLRNSTITARTLLNGKTLYLSTDSVIATTEKVYNLGTMVGSGTIIGDLVNEGRLSMDWSQDAGQLTITGNFIQTAGGVLNLRIGASSTTCDQLIVGGTAQLDGTLSITLMAGYVPSAGDSFQALSFGAQSGDFANFNLPDLGDAMYVQAWSDGTGYYFTVQSNT